MGSDGDKIGLDSFFELFDIFENPVAADVFKVAHFHLLAIKVNILFINEVHFEHLWLVFVEGAAMADVGCGIVEAVSCAQPGGIDSAGRKHVVIRFDIGGGITQATADLFAVHDGAYGADGLTEHAEHVIEMTQLDGFPDAGA